MSTFLLDMLGKQFWSFRAVREDPAAIQPGYASKGRGAFLPTTPTGVWSQTRRASAKQGSLFTPDAALL